MVSKTKYSLNEAEVRRIFDAVKLHGVTSISPLGAGEYNAVYAVTAGAKEYALKVAPKDGIPVLTYETDMMKAELYWYEQIRKHTTIRVPEVYATDFTHAVVPVNYFIMEKLAGTPMVQMKRSSQEKADGVAQLARMAAQIHRIPGEKAGYIQNQLYDNWYLAIRSCVQALLKDQERMGRKSKPGQRLLHLIEENRSLLERVECTMVNFDIHASNIICRREGGAIQYAWIDPERSYWGDPVADFVCLEMLTPLAKKSASLRAYNEEADKKIHPGDEEKRRYAIAEGYIGLIMETEKYYRYTPRNFGWWRNIIAANTFYRSAFGALR